MISRFASAAAAAACAAMAATPLAAAELPQFAAPIAVEATGVFDADAVNADQYRRYYRRNRTSAGDVIGAVVAIGAIAAVASAVSKASTRSRDGDYRYPQHYPYPDRRYDYRSNAPDVRYDGSRGLDRAVDMCAREIERNARIDTVDNANRTGDGWTVTGRLRTGDAFTCTIGADGRIDGIDYGRRGATNDRQWDDERYAAARAEQDGAGVAPAYPGGPVENESDDGRYETAQAPDFNG